MVGRFFLVKNLQRRRLNLSPSLATLFPPNGEFSSCPTTTSSSGQRVRPAQQFEAGEI